MASRRTIFANKSKQQPDIRPALMSLAALMMILLPTLLLITSPQKLTALTLSISADGQQIPSSPNGVISSLVLTVTPGGYMLNASLRKTDVLASATDTEQKQWILSEWSEVLSTLTRLKELDPKRSRIELRPLPNSQAQQIVRWMDSLQAKDRFPEVIISAQGAQ